MCNVGDAASSASGQNILIRDLHFRAEMRLFSGFATGQLGLFNDSKLLPRIAAALPLASASITRRFPSHPFAPTNMSLWAEHLE